MLNDLDVNELNERVEQELAQQKKVVPGVMLALSFLMVVLFSIIGAGLAADGETGIGVFMAVMGGAMAVFFQFISFMITSGASDNSMRAQLVSKAMAGILRDLPKRKNTPRNNLEDEAEVDEGEVVMLGDDGELKRAKR
jgi:hypothetical protein